MTNWLAQEQWVLDAFAEGRDLYSESASKHYGRTITKADKTERFLFKTAELGCQYGMGAPKFQTTVKNGGVIIEEYEARAAVNSYRSTHPRVVQLWKIAGENIFKLANKESFTWGPMEAKGGYLYAPNGSFMDYTTIIPDPDGKGHVQVRKGVNKRIYGGLITQNCAEFLSRLKLAQAALEIARRYRIVTLTHDEVVCLAPETEAAEALQWVLDVLRKPPLWAPDIPLDA